MKCSHLKKNPYLNTVIKLNTGLLYYEHWTGKRKRFYTDY